MDFDDTPEEAAFRAEAHAWLAAHATPRRAEDFMFFGLTDARSQSEAAYVERSREWQRTLYDGGWAGISWPKEHGGRGEPLIHQLIFAEEQARFDVPGSIFAVGIGMAGPTLMVHGTDEQKDRFLAPMLRGDEVWCQLFSEPGSGSDLAGLRTRAVRDGDEYVVNGQKVWTSGAHYSDWGILLARTDPEAPKHRGITYFLLDMRTPGVDVRPLRQLTGDAHFNEVFLNDVRVPAANVIGHDGAGWGVAVTTLMNERTLIGTGSGSFDLFSQVRRLVDHRGGAVSASLRQDLARAYIGSQLLRYMGWRVQTALSKGALPGPESSVLKLGYSRHLEALGDLVMSVQGAHGTLLGEEAADQFASMQFLGQWSARIGGGTEQIQRNVISERVLGLPGEPRTDKTVPFSQLPS